MEERKALAELQNVEKSCSKGNIMSIKTSLSEEDDTRYKALLATGKDAAKVGELTTSLEAFKKAYDMKQTEKILKRIQKIEGLLSEIEEDNEDFVELDNGLVIYRQLVERLYPHQIQGVKWIYDLFRKKKKGGILADDMGLGKTIQVIAALSAMFDMDVLQHVLLVLPLSLIPNWQREFEKWAPGIRIKCFHGTTRERNAALDHIQRRAGVCMTTYGLIQTKFEQLGETKFREEFVWDYIILDEGHKIKNPTKTTKGLHAIPSKNRLILTGTPIQNNLRELWALFDWIMQGTLLGTQRTFKMEYETPITRARQRGASSAEIHLGNYMSESLRKIVDPYILRRTKGSVSAPKLGGSMVDKNQEENEIRNAPSFPKLKKKNDFVIWTFLSDIQEEIYRDFLQQDSIKQLLASKKSPLVYLNILKKICDHPRLLSRKACHELGLEANDKLEDEDIHSQEGKECAANRIDNISDETLIKESGKLQFLIQLLEILKEEGHRTLIFSLSRKVLNVVQRILLNRKFKVMRLDGTITKLSERELRVKKFQSDSSYEVFLLTTQVGGVGLTLTAADRVVVYDPSWNPATDAQAVDRIYRIGQEKNVVVYRLITCGTVEEKIYRRQIFKDSIIKQSTGDNNDPYRYFTNHELKELFQLESTKDSVTQRQLQDLHGDQRCLDPRLADHIAHIHSLPMFGISDHDLMFSQDPDDVDPTMVEEDKNSIRNKVAEARVRVEQEAKHFTGGESAEARWGDFEVKPSGYQPRIPSSEPVYPVEGLYDDLDSLKIDDELVESIFKKDEKGHYLNEPILVADSPTLDLTGRDDSKAIEVDESFVAETAVSTEALFKNDISSIQPSTFTDKNSVQALRSKDNVEMPSPSSFSIDKPNFESIAHTLDSLMNTSTSENSFTKTTNESSDKSVTLSNSTAVNDSVLNETTSEIEEIDSLLSKKLEDSSGSLVIDETVNETDLAEDEINSFLSDKSDNSNGVVEESDFIDENLDKSKNPEAINITNTSNTSGRDMDSYEDNSEDDNCLLDSFELEAMESNSRVAMDATEKSFLPDKSDNGNVVVQESNLIDENLDKSNLSNASRRDLDSPIDNSKDLLDNLDFEAMESNSRVAMDTTENSGHSRSHGGADELPDFDEEDGSDNRTYRSSKGLPELSDIESSNSENTSLKLDDIDIEDFNLDESDDGVVEKHQADLSVHSPMHVAKKRGRLISESSESGDEEPHDRTPLPKTGPKVTPRRRSSAAPLRSFIVSDDSFGDADGRSSIGSRIPSLQVSFESENEDLFL